MDRRGYFFGTIKKIFGAAQDTGGLRIRQIMASCVLLNFDLIWHHTSRLPYPLLLLHFSPFFLNSSHIMYTKHYQHNINMTGELSLLLQNRSMSSCRSLFPHPSPSGIQPNHFNQAYLSSSNSRGGTASGAGGSECGWGGGG